MSGVAEPQPPRHPNADGTMSARLAPLMEVQGLWSRVQGLGFRVQGLGFGVWCLGFGVSIWGLGFRGSGFGVWLSASAAVGGIEEVGFVLEALPPLTYCIAATEKRESTVARALSCP